MNKNFNEDDFLQELNEAILEQEEKELEVNFEDEGFIKNQSQANYFCKLINNLKEERETKNSYIDEELNRIKNLYEQYRTKENIEIDRKINFFEKSLKTFTQKELEGSKKKSIKLPYGTLSIKKQQNKFEYDDQQVMNWLKCNGQESYITTKTTEAIDKKSLKKDGKIIDGCLIINNVVVDGVDVIAQEDKFTVS